MNCNTTHYRANSSSVPGDPTWDTVPGLYEPEEDKVLIATRIENGERRVPSFGNGHACGGSLVMHEVAHALDYHGDPGADVSPTDAAFIAAREADLASLDPHQLQPGSAGLEETYAESLGRFFGGDPTLKADWPHLHAYWARSRYATGRNDP